MTVYENNLSYFKSIDPDFYQKLTTLKGERCRIEPSKSGQPTLSYRVGAEHYQIHSKYNPVKEGDKVIQNKDLTADHIVVLGLGLGYHVDILRRSIDKSTRVLVIEPDLEIFWSSLHVLDWSEILSNGNFHFYVGEITPAFSDKIIDFFRIVTYNKLETIELPSEARIFSTYFSQLKGVIDQEIKTLLYDFKTRLAEQSMVIKNTIRNISDILKTRPVKHLKEKFSGRAGFIVSAGPSLDKNILFLKKIRDRAVLIAVDTALKPLLKRGIQPHFTISADPSYKNYLHLQGTDEEMKYFLLAESALSNQVYKEFGPHIFCTTLGKPIFKMIEESVGEVGEIAAWGSVISLAVNFAIYTGLSPITFLGQDFAFSQMRNHCRGTSWEEKWLEQTQDLDQLQRKEKKSIGGIKKSIETQDIYGNKTITSDKLVLYRNYLEKLLVSHPEIEFINATEGGILNIIPRQNIHQVLRKFVYSKDPLDFSSLFKLPHKDNPSNRKNLQRFFKSKLTYFKKYRNKLSEAITKIENSTDLTANALVKVLDEVDQVKNDLYSETNLNNASIVEMWSEAPIYEFLRKSEKIKKQELNETYIRDFMGAFKEYFHKLKPMMDNIIDTFQMGIELMAKEKR